MLQTKLNAIEINGDSYSLGWYAELLIEISESSAVAAHRKVAESLRMSRFDKQEFTVEP